MSDAEPDFYNATCADCGLSLTRPYDAIWKSSRPWQFVPGRGHLCPVCQESTDSEAAA